MTAATRVIALLGDPVAHSASPEIQNAAFASAGVDGVYVAVRCGADDLVGFMRGLARAGGGGNVTLPHKEKAASLLDDCTDAVRRTGACNTFWADDGGRLHGDNTDVDGFRRAMRDFAGGNARGFRVLLLGAGGAARAALLGLIEEGAEEVLIYNRTQDRARAVGRVAFTPTCEQRRQGQPSAAEAQSGEEVAAVHRVTSRVRKLGERTIASTSSRNAPSLARNAAATSSSEARSEGRMSWPSA